MVWEHLVISNVDVKLYLEGGPSGLGPKDCLLLWGRAESLLPRQGHIAGLCKTGLRGAVGSSRDDFH